MALGGVRRRKDRGNRYEVTWFDPHGRRRRILLPPTFTKDAAMRVYSKHLDESGRVTHGLPPKTPITFGEFVGEKWRKEVAIGLKPSTLRTYDGVLTHHLLPAFGDLPLRTITRATVKAFIAEKATQQRWDYTNGHRPRSDRPLLSRKTILNMVAVLSAMMETATVDYELLSANPLRGILRRRHFPTAAFRPHDSRPPILEPDDFKAALAELASRPRRIVVFAALTGLRWGELVGLRMEDVDFRRNRLRITRSLYRRVALTPKEERSERDVDMMPTVRRILEAVPWTEGYVFSEDGKTPIGDGSWIKREWRKAQERAGMRHPVRWHDLRHQFVSLLIAAGKHPKYVAAQAGHSSAGFTLDRYGHLFDTLPITPVEWPEDLLWPGGLPGELERVLMDLRTRQTIGRKADDRVDAVLASTPDAVGR
ncbi:MAG: tyrosine-type recombinase/integrase [bacterium]